MPLVAAAVCPHPPLIVPLVAAGAAAETDDLRAAADAAVATLLRADPDQIVVVGGHTRTELLPEPYRGDFTDWGVAEGWPSEPDTTVPPVRSLGLLVGGWLLHRHRGVAPVVLAGVAAGLASSPAAALGAEWAGRAPRVAMLVMGDGSACRGLKAPGYDDPRAEPYDRVVSTALSDADADALLGLDQELSTQLKVAGRVPWQVLAGAARAAGTAWRGEVTYDAAPYGVAYLVARWSPA